MRHVYSNIIRVSFGAEVSYLSPTKMFPGLVEKESESKHRLKKAKMQRRHKIPRQTQVRNEIADLNKINGFADTDHPNSPCVHMIQYNIPIT